MNKKIRFLVQGALIAALYVVMTYVANLFGLASGVIQVRISEALTVLPFFTPAAIPGLFVGCLLSNLLTGCAPWDVVFGSLATLLGALGTYAIAHSGKGSKLIKKWAAPLPPILANTLIIPWVLRFVYAAPDSIPFLMLTVGAGEVISCGFLGLILLFALEPRAGHIFRNA
ncbi:MAG: QueT transporter family protein [Lachnospiraceae bacterium]|nr:QueT transporter family protein [Lachnospiraceae bacterium]